MCEKENRKRGRKTNLPADTSRRFVSIRPVGVRTAGGQQTPTSGTDWWVLVSQTLWLFCFVFLFTRQSPAGHNGSPTAVFPLSRLRRGLSFLFPFHFLLFFSCVCVCFCSFLFFHFLFLFVFFFLLSNLKQRSKTKDDRPRKRKRRKRKSTGHQRVECRRRCQPWQYLLFWR